MNNPTPPPPDGDVCDKPSYGRYTHGCRCEGCRQAQRDYKADRKRRFQLGRIEAEHGKNATYVVLGCRCDLCRAAHNEAQAPLNAARLRAMEKLRERHLTEYRELLKAERERV